MTRAAALKQVAPAERSLAETAYANLKAGIFEFELLPGDRFSETEIAERLKMSRRKQSRFLACEHARL